MMIGDLSPEQVQVMVVPRMDAIRSALDGMAGGHRAPEQSAAEFSALLMTAAAIHLSCAGIRPAGPIVSRVLLAMYEAANAAVDAASKEL